MDISFTSDDDDEGDSLKAKGNNTSDLYYDTNKSGGKKRLPLQTIDHP